VENEADQRSFTRHRDVAANQCIMPRTVANFPRLQTSTPDARAPRVDTAAAAWQKSPREGDLMQLHRRILGALAMAAALFGLSACATGPSVTPEQMADIRAGQQSAIIMSYREFQGLYSAYVVFVNVETRRSYAVSMHGGDNWVNAGPDMVSVPPGRYRVLRGGLAGYEVTGTMPLLPYWFDEFEVGPGEVVDVGTITIEDVNVRSLPGMSDQIFNALFSLDPAQRDVYYVYNIDYSDEARVQHMLESKYPDLGVAPVRRPLRIMLDRATFEQVIVDGYARSPDGALPTTQEARARVTAGLAAFLAESHGRADVPAAIDPPPTLPAAGDATK
jgi:hypothetical protein